MREQALGGGGGAGKVLGTNTLFFKGGGAVATASIPELNLEVKTLSIVVPVSLL